MLVRMCKTSLMKTTIIALSTGTDRPLLNAVSDQGVHSLPYIQHYFRHIKRQYN